MQSRSVSLLLLWAAAAVVLAAVLGSPLARAAAPLSTTTVLFDSNRTGNFELFSMNSDGTNQVQLTNNAAYDSWWPKLSPDRTKIMFVRVPAGVHDTDITQMTTWVMNVDGTGLTQILPLGAHGWILQGHPEWSPDGTKIVTMGGPTANNPQIYTVNADGTNPVRVTSNGAGLTRFGVNIDPSWKPDGQYVLFVGCPPPGPACLQRNYEVFRIKTDGTGETRLTNNNKPDYDPYYSPNTTGFPGTGTIAYLRNTSSGPTTKWGIFKMNPDGSSPGTVIDDGAINSKPAWSVDSSTIYFHRVCCGASQFNVWKIAPNGTGLTEIILPRPPYGNEYPVNSSF